MRARYYILVGIIAYLAFLITTIPAAPVFGMYKDHIPVTITKVSGSLWSGQADIIITNKLVLKDVQWSFLPLRLLLAQIAIDVDAAFNNNPLNARLSVGLSGDLDVHDLDMKLDATDVASMFVLPIGELSGNFLLQISNATFQPGSVPHIVGTLNWNQAAVTVAETADLGNVAVLINENDDSPLTASISNNGGQLTLNGGLNTDQAGNYSLKLNIRPNASASYNLINTLSMIAKKQPNGTFVIINKGNLEQLRLM